MVVDSVKEGRREVATFCGQASLEDCVCGDCFVMIFDFQAEDGIRDYKVTGVQTCALPIWEPIHAALVEPRLRPVRAGLLVAVPALVGLVAYGQVRTTVAAPPNLRSIHPAPPSE